MARKPKVIEVPGDTAPAQFEALAKKDAAPTPAEPAHGEIVERRGGWVLRHGIGWFKEGI